MKFVTREAWNATQPKSVSAINNPAIGIGLHWNGNSMGTFAHDRCAGKVKNIQNQHMAKGWVDIAYNYLVCPHGYVFEGRGLGRRSAANGTNDGNAKYYAVCGLFGLTDPFTMQMKQAYLDTIHYLRANGMGQAVRSHSSFKSTDCPGDGVRQWIVAGFPANDYTPTPTNDIGEQEMIDKIYQAIHNPDGTSIVAGLAKDMTSLKERVKNIYEAIHNPDGSSIVADLSRRLKALEDRQS